MDKINFELGFKKDGLFYGYLNGELYQLPFTNHEGRYFGLRHIPKKYEKSGWVFYRVQRKKIGMVKLRSMLKPINWSVNKPQI